MPMSTQNGQGSQNSPSGPVSDQAALSSTPFPGLDEDRDFDLDAAHDVESCPCSHCCAQRYEANDARRAREFIEMGLSEHDFVEPSPERPDRERRPRRARDPHLDVIAMVEAEVVLPPSAAPTTGADFMARVRERQATDREFGLRTHQFRPAKRPSGALRRALED